MDLNALQGSSNVAYIIDKQSYLIFNALNGKNITHPIED